MWKAGVGQNINIVPDSGADDDWETDPDFVNDVNEQEQRWGSTTIQGSGRTAGAIDMSQLRKETEEADALKKKKQMEDDPSNPSFGYGGKFGVEKDRMDQSAVGHEYIAKVEKHASQKDYSTGFGGKFGVQSDRVDKSAVSWEHKEKIEKHTSQKDYVSGFGGKFGVQTDRQDKSAVGWDHVEKVEKHESQKDYSKGFGGKFGVQTDRVDKSAVGWDHHEAPQKHESQTDHKIGFGGKFGLQTDRVDKSAASFDEAPSRVGTNYTKVKPDIAGAKPSDLRAKFETMGQERRAEEPKVATPKKTVHARATMFQQAQQQQKEPAVPVERKAMDKSKTAFLTQKQEPEVNTMTTTVPGALNPAKIAQFTEAAKEEVKEENVVNRPRTEILDQGGKEEIGEREEDGEYYAQVEETAPSYETKSMPEKEPTPVVPPVDPVVKEEEQIYQNVEETNAVEDQESDDEIVDTGIVAVALYDYQAAADDEISFDPDDTITHIEKIDEGWWRGLCKGKYGLFPANYVQVE